MSNIPIWSPLLVHFDSSLRKSENGNNFLKPKSKYGIQNLQINIKQSTNPGITKTKNRKLPNSER